MTIVKQTLGEPFGNQTDQLHFFNLCSSIVLYDQLIIHFVNKLITVTNVNNSKFRI